MCDLGCTGCYLARGGNGALLLILVLLCEVCPFVSLGLTLGTYVWHMVAG
jgi:hypothetical protein